MMGSGFRLGVMTRIFAVALLALTGGCQLATPTPGVRSPVAGQPHDFKAHVYERLNSTPPRDFFAMLDTLYAEATTDEDRKLVIYAAGDVTRFQCDPVPLLMRLGKDGNSDLGLLALYQLRPVHAARPDVQQLYVDALRSASRPQDGHLLLIEWACEVADLSAPYEACLLEIIEGRTKWPLKYRAAAADSLGKFLLRSAHVR
jgi:hypothetical protein